MKKVLIISIIVILVILVFCVALSWQYFSEIFKFYPNEIKTQNKTAGWKTYTNAEYGFEIKYPPYFSIKESGRPDLGASFNNDKKDININWVRIGWNVGMKGPIAFNKNIEVNQKCNNEICGAIRILNNFVIGGERAISYESIGWPSRIPSISTVIEKDGGSIILDVSGEKEVNIENIKEEDYSGYADLEKVHDELLSTFKFTR